MTAPSDRPAPSAPWLAAEMTGAVRTAALAPGILRRHMPSPFPGMDPYLEPHWLDVHTSLVSGARDALNALLPDDLIASAEERVAVESDSGGDRVFARDVRVFEAPGAGATTVEAPAAAAVGMPYRLLAHVEPITERCIRIVEARTERLITVIEFVSPMAKQRDGLHAFRSKRAALLASGVSFVEIDLVPRRRLAGPAAAPRLPATSGVHLSADGPRSGGPGGRLPSPDRNGQSPALRNSSPPENRPRRAVGPPGVARPRLRPRQLPAPD